MPLTLQDKHDIQELIVKYAYAIDIDCEESEFLDLFTEDAALISPVSGVHEGVDGLKKFLNRHVLNHGKVLIRHFITNFIIDGDGDEGTLKAYFFEYKTTLAKPDSPTPSTTEFLFCGNYDCTVRRVAGKWKLHTRTVHVDHLSHAAA